MPKDGKVVRMQSRGVERREEEMGSERPHDEEAGAAAERRSAKVNLAD